jgi:hypothetical protein
MAHLKSFRSYSEHDVVNMFAYHGDFTISNGNKVYTNGANINSRTDVLPAGTVVEIDTTAPLSLNGGTEDLASFSTTNGVVSNRYGVKAGLVKGDSTNYKNLGLTLMTVRNFYENNENLAFNPRKAAEMGVVLLGQVVPVVTEGLFALSIVNNAVDATGAPMVAGAGWDLYVGVGDNAGRLVTSKPIGNYQRVGVLLSTLSSDGVGLVKVNFDFSSVGVATQIAPDNWVSHAV